MAVLKPAFGAPNSKAIGFSGVEALRKFIYMLYYSNTKI
jgi:hypothetical protein